MQSSQSVFGCLICTLVRVLKKKQERNCCHCTRRRSSSWNSDSALFSFLSQQNCILDDALRTVGWNSDVCSIDGIPRGRLELVFLVRCTWTATPAPRHPAGVRPDLATTHLCSFCSPPRASLLFYEALLSHGPSHFCESQLA